MIGQNKITYEKLNILTGAQMALAVADLREYYKMDRLPQPPLPNHALYLVPCNLRVTETHGANGLKTGKVLITSPSGETLFEQEWLVSPGSS